MEERTRRVCILGAESTGKTTLACALAEAYGTLFNPEFGRPYTEVGRPRDAPWTSVEFAHIAKLHCWYEDFLAKHASRVLFCDTDAFTTVLFHEAYLGSPARGFDDLAARRYDLYLVCGLDVPWARDEIREFEAQRRWMHERLVEWARSGDEPWQILDGPHELRLASARRAIDDLLAR